MFFLQNCSIFDQLEQHGGGPLARYGLQDIDYAPNSGQQKSRPAARLQQSGSLLRIGWEGHKKWPLGLPRGAYMPSSIVNYTRSDFRYQCQSAPIFLPEKFSFQYQLTATLSPTLLPPSWQVVPPLHSFLKPSLRIRSGMTTHQR